MRYSTVFKFIAFVLCAATLLGMVASAAGIIFLTELGEKSVEGSYQDQLRNQSVSYAMSVGGMYASEHLGGAPRNVANEYYDWQLQYFDTMQVGYTLCDSEGNVLQEMQLPDNGRKVVFEEEIPVSGRYMKVISTTPREEHPDSQQPGSENIRVVVMPSQEMTEIGTVYLDYTDGSRDEIRDEEVVGWLYLHPDVLVFETNRINHIPMGDGWYVNHILLADMGGNIVYEVFGDTHVIQAMDGTDNQLVLTLPKGMVTAAAPVGLTYTQGDYTSYDAIPTQGVTVTSMSVTYSNLQGEAMGSEGTSSPDLIGTLFHDPQGNAVFQSTEPMTMDIPEDCIISTVTFMDAQNNALFEANCPGGVGIIEYDEDGCLVFKGQMPGTVIPEETVPEESAPAAGRENAKAYVVPGTAVYAAPNLQSQVLEMLDETEVEVIQQRQLLVDGETQNWCLIQQGWLPLEEITFVYTVQTEETDTAASGSRKIYATPSLDAKELGELSPEETPEILRQDVFGSETWGLIPEGWILLEAGEPEAASTEPEAAAEVTEEPQTRTAAEPAAAAETETALSVEAEDSLPAETEETLPAQTETYPAEDIQTGHYYDSELRQEMDVQYVWEPIPEGYTLEIRLTKGALRNELGWTLLRLAESFRHILLEFLGICIAVFALCVVHLCCSAGRTRRNNEVRAGGLNRIPLDLYLVGGGFGVVGLVAAAVIGSEYFARNDEQLALVFCGACAYLVCLLVVGFFFAFVAQTKTPGGYWWRHSFCGWCIKLMILGCTGAFDLCIRVWKNGMPLVRRIFGWLWNTGRRCVQWLWDTGKRLGRWILAMTGKCFVWTTAKLVRFFGLLPITWQFLLTGFTLVFLLYVVLRSYKVGWILVGFGLFFATILYAASAFAILLESAKRMSKGDLDTKVDDKLLIGGFREFAGELNDLADVAVVAAQKQLKSERMKTELITNVSHDIKTPLTSIINYVDLLQKPHTEAEQTQYLEVLDRQSQRLKKLIDDLMDMSKASTGNMAVEISRMDAVETVNQALGEFADKLERAQLIPVFRQPEETVEMMADGRLVWRIMSNLLGNAVKYALPGTRIYVDLLEMDGKVIISMKNISREELNVHADELLERFVRGDASRNTEGSGLGLNIAQSLMELQKGQLQILVDGDLFKVTLIFPAA